MKLGNAEHVMSLPMSTLVHQGIKNIQFHHPQASANVLTAVNRTLNENEPLTYTENSTKLLFLESPTKKYF